MADVEPGPPLRVADVLVDRQRAVNQPQQLVRVHAQRAALAARDRDVEQPQEIVHALAEIDLGRATCETKLVDLVGSLSALTKLTRARKTG